MRKKTLKRVAAAASIAALALASSLGIAEATRTVRIASRITIESHGLTFSGRVRSGNAACESARRVTLYREHALVLGSTTTNAAGTWKITASGSAGITLGHFYARVKRRSEGTTGTIYVCGAARSRTIPYRPYALTPPGASGHNLAALRSGRSPKSVAYRPETLMMRGSLLIAHPRGRRSTPLTLVLWTKGQIIPRMPRVAAIGLSLTAIAMLLAGCGSGGGSSGSKEIASGTGLSAVQQRALAYARAVNLRASDLPALVGDRRGERVAKSYPFAQCGRGISHVGQVLGVFSQGLGSKMKRRRGNSYTLSLLPTERVSSAVYVMQSAGIAARDLAAARGAEIRACIKRALEGGTVEKGEPIFSRIDVSTLPSPWRPRLVFGQRVTASLGLSPSSTGGRTPYYEDLFAFTVGPAVVTLDAIGDPRPFPAGTERRLLALLHRRAEAHAL
jgi:hypothetical protein